MATDFYLKLDGCEGESQKEGHTKEIEVVSWSWSGHNSGTFAAGSGGGSGKFSSTDLSLQALVSKASPKLIQACTKGSHIDKGVLSCRKSGRRYEALRLSQNHLGALPGRVVPERRIRGQRGACGLFLAELFQDHLRVFRAGCVQGNSLFDWLH